MFVQTEITPNPNSLKFLPGKAVSPNESFEITKKNETSNELVRNLLSINGVEGNIFWEEILLQLINMMILNGKKLNILLYH